MGEGGVFFFRDLAEDRLIIHLIPLQLLDRALSPALASLMGFDSHQTKAEYLGDCGAQIPKSIFVLGLSFQAWLGRMIVHSGRVVFLNSKEHVSLTDGKESVCKPVLNHLGESLGDYCRNKLVLHFCYLTTIRRH
jgi:hypothetical protein